MRTKIIAGNWKMNKDINESNSLINEIIQQASKENLNSLIKIVIAPPFTNLSEASKLTKDNKLNIHIAAQNCHYEEKGAFTGEIAPQMLKVINTEYVILGHSERRQYFCETDSIIAKKINAVLNHKMTPIYCCGEVLEERENNSYKEVIKRQISEALFNLTSEQLQNVVIAYEPVWAIGTGKTATPQQAQEIHKLIRETVRTKYPAVADNISILYGGSCKPDNAQEIFNMPDIDGGLIGGASLKANDFLDICKAMHIVLNNKA